MTKFRLIYLLVAFALALAACGQAEPDVQAVVDPGADQEDGALNSQDVSDRDDASPSSSTTSSSTTSSSTTPSSTATNDADNFNHDETAVEPKPEPEVAETLDSAEGQTMLAAVVADTEAASSGRFEGRLTMGLEPGAGAGDVSILIDGSFDLDNEATELTIDLSQITTLMEESGGTGDDPLMALGMFPGMFDDPIRLISIGDSGYLQWPFITSLFGSLSPDGASGSVPPNELWIEGTADDLSGATDGLGASDLTDDILPTDLLDQLREANATVEDLGPDTVRGDAVTRYRVTMDAESLAAMSDDLSVDDLTELEGLQGQTMDLWVDEQGLARKMFIEIDADAMGDSDGEDLGDTSLDSVTLEFELFDLGNPVDIAPPSTDKVLSSDDLGFGFDESSFGS